MSARPTMSAMARASIKAKSPHRHDSAAEQTRLMGYRAGMQDAINAVYAQWKTCPYGIPADMAAPVRDHVIRELSRLLREADRE